MKQTGAVNFFYRPGGFGNPSAGILSAAGFDDDAWHWFLFVSRAANDYEAYIDGSSEGTATTNITLTETPNLTQVGGDGIVPVNSVLARFMNFTSALTVQEAETLARGRLVVQPNLWWELGWGDPEPDFSGQGYNGTINSAMPAGAHPPVASFFEQDHDWLGAFTAASTEAVTTSLTAALRAQKTLAMSLGGALQKDFTRASALDAALARTQTRSTALQGAIAAQQALTLALDAAVRKPKTASTVLGGALALSRSQQAALRGALSVAGTLGLGLGASITGAGSTAVTTELGAALQKAMALTSILSAAIQAPAGVSAMLDAGIALQREIAANLGAAVAITRLAQVPLGGVLSEGRSVAAGLSTSIVGKIGAPGGRTHKVAAEPGHAVPARPAHVIPGDGRTYRVQ